MSTLSALAGDVDVLVVVNPNSPTGTTLATEDVLDVAAGNPRTTFLVDESFLPFCGQPSLVGVMEREPLQNVVVLASLSSLFGVPGLRLGYLYSADVALLQRFSDFMPTWGVNALAEYFLELALKFRTQLASSIELTVTERERMRGQLAKHPLVERVYPSGANFLLVDLRRDSPESAAAVRAGLLEAGIEVGDVSAEFAERVPRLRVTVRSQEHNDRFLKALREVHALTAR
jgi:histidinol-phosphate/aromatic aminotransferase/cobyric acid decarboxylase-like protein